MSKTIVALDTGASSPFRILSPGRDPLNPALEDTIFDGSQQPLRKKQKGAISIPVGPGWGYGPGGYSAVSTPIASPYPSGRHYAVALGVLDSEGIYRTPFQQSIFSTLATSGGSVNVYGGNGIGVGADASNVYGFSSYTPTPQIGTIGYIYIYFPGYPYGYYRRFPVSGWTGGSTPRSATVHYLLFQNTIG